MRSLDEIKQIRNYIIETNKFENINLFMGYSTEETIDKYIERFELTEDIKPLIINYYAELDTSTHRPVKINATPLQMLLHVDEINEYCNVCAYSHDYYLKEDTVELNEGEFVAKEHKNEYAIAVDDNKYHLKEYMSYIEEHDEYVYSSSYKQEHYRFAIDDDRWHRAEDVTEVSDMPAYTYQRNVGANYTNYVYSEEYLDDNYAIDERGIYRLRENMEWIEETEEWIFDREYLSDNYGYCNECNRYVPRENGTWLDNYDIWVCNDCLDEHYSVRCEICGEYIRDGREMYIENDEGEEIAVCEDCYHDDVAFRIDSDVNPDEYIGRYHCNNGVWKEYRCDDEDENVILYGHELEIEPKRGGKYNLSKAASSALNNLNCILSHDGSLKRNGFEIVSQPQSYKYIMEHYSTYEEVFKEIVENGYVSHNSSNCGLHFHVTAPKENRDEIVGRLWLIIETYKEQFQALSRRKGEFGWCRFLSSGNKESVYKLAKIAKEDNENTRYLVINDRNPNTIEIRLFKGTLNPRTFFADLQLVHNLFKIAYNLDMSLTDVTFDMLIEGDIISEYCKENNIYSDKRIKDDSAKYIVLENKIINLTKNILDILWKEIEVMKEAQYTKISKKLANRLDKEAYIMDYVNINRRLSDTLNFYVRTRNSYEKKRIENIIYNLNDIKYYITDDTVNKKLEKIMKYNEELSA